MQAYLDKRHRQQNKEILIRHSPGIGECFFVFKYSINRKNKKISSGGCNTAPDLMIVVFEILYYYKYKKFGGFIRGWRCPAGQLILNYLLYERGVVKCPNILFTMMSLSIAEKSIMIQ